MLVLQQRVSGFGLREEDRRTHDIAVAVYIAPAAFLFHLRVGVVVVSTHGGHLFVHWLYGPAAEVIHETPQSVFGVGDRHAPCVVVAAHCPLCTSLFGLFGAHEDVVYHKHSATVYATPAVVLSDGGVALRVTSFVGTGFLVDGLVFPAAVVVYEAPATVGGIAGRVYPFAGFGHLLPLATSFLRHFLGGEHIAAHHVAVDVYAAPTSVDLHRCPSPDTSLELAGALVLWHQLPGAIVVFVAKSLRSALKHGFLCLGAHCEEHC